MEQTLKVPDFETEGEEARWWAENQGQLAEQFKRAAAEGKLGRGTVARRGSTPTTTIRLDPEDIARARFHAERRGLKYQTYLKMLIHQALREEESQSAPNGQQGDRKKASSSKHPHSEGRSRKDGGETRKKRSR